MFTLVSAYGLFFEGDQWPGSCWSFCGKIAVCELRHWPIDLYFILRDCSKAQTIWETSEWQTSWLDATSPVLKNQLEVQVFLAWEPPDMGCQNMNVDAPRRMASGGFGAGKQFEHCTLLHVYREKNAVADGIANGAITLIWESKFDHVVLFIRRLQIMIKDVNEQLQSSVKTSDSFFLESYPMRLSMARIGFYLPMLSFQNQQTQHVFFLEMSANLGLFCKESIRCSKED
ncbi:hypothetical protein ACFX13_037214 [Malus domestica]